MQYIGRTKGRLFECWEFLLDCLFPKHCFVCQKEGEYVCSACFDKIELAQNKCYLCQTETEELGICPACQNESKIDSIIVATPYTGNIAGQMVESLKYNYVEDLAPILSRLIEKRIERDKLKTLVTNKLLIPIPLHKKRFLERGFNQSELLAEELGQRFHCQVENKLLKRIRYTAQQAKLTRTERLENIKEAFIAGSISQNLEEVILVDDVVTTGSTLSEAAKALKQVGIKKVIAVAVCHG
ncbi:MAG: hypothetical protein UT32_C0012G0012 [Parcubacteria group bacterium GW2011_GWC2_39_14]|nr:MAG: hypothetical protein UT32_C0012G0012 [Parcubacteria group bacterium GW2011_GWC2_39_14]KKR55183.1 MAG: hypothetical protein UT91_C0004G0082 [Parcubacteria group bacterium GW2011_GWA2_40_23]